MATGSESVAASSSNFDEEIKKLMGKGKVHMVCSEFVDAVKCFEEATKRLDENYGLAADECGEAYFYYGKSLLEVARMEGGVLGNALQGAIDPNVQESGGETTSQQNSSEDKNKQENTTAKTGSSEGTSSDGKTDKQSDLFVGPDISEIDEDEKEKIGKQVTEAMTEEALKEAMQEDSSNKDDKATSTEKETSDKDESMEASDDATEKSETTSQVQEVAKASGDKTQEETSTKKEEATKEEKSTDENKDTSEGEDDENAEDDDEAMDAEDEEVGEVEQLAADEEEPTYMELAWEMLEIARNIFNRRERKEKLMLAQCHLKLGEIQMEQEQFLGAVEDFLKCLDIQKEHLSPDDRLLAETAYNIGLAFSFQSMYEKSKDYYSQALETIGNRIKSLQQSIDEADAKGKGKEKATPDNPSVANRKELQELQELYPEIKAKVDDAEEMMKQSKDKPSISSVMGNGTTTTIGFGSSSSHECTKPVTMIATKKKTPMATTDISHLVHRNKRKPDEAEDDDTAAKKPRQDLEASDDKTQTANGNTEAATAET